MTKVVRSILIPSAKGCQLCEPSLCVSFFDKCAEEAVAVTVHCLDRTSNAAFLAVFSLMVVTVTLTVGACCRHSKFGRKLLGMVLFSPGGRDTSKGKTSGGDRRTRGVSSSQEGTNRSGASTSRHASRGTGAPSQQAIREERTRVSDQGPPVVEMGGVGDLERR
ncbi:unnamed protein product [Amoebophrya sp. A25]|nr:unnamed protein product [Amoebophrya sp. A25]|eukprot:GSA25T00026860001.1